jgi:hypothetical protein
MRILPVLAALGCGLVLAACARAYVERPARTQVPVVHSVPGATIVTPPGGGSTVILNPSY